MLPNYSSTYKGGLGIASLFFFWCPPIALGMIILHIVLKSGALEEE